MKAVLFAAGLGTRLYPHTLDKPKALVSIQGRPMLYRVMDKLYEAGIREYVVNVHAFAGQVEKALELYALSKPGISFDISDERDLLLETGGGLKKMAAFLKDGPFLVHNVDVLSDIDLKLFMEQALGLLSVPFQSQTQARPQSQVVPPQSQVQPQTQDQLQTGGQYPLAVLAVRNDFKNRCFLLNQHNLLCGWENRRSGEQKISRQQEDLHPVGFMGIHCISPSIFHLMEEEGVFSIIDVYLRLARQHIILGLDQSACKWMDIGSPEQLLLAEKQL
jgi:NDP-sugar pyrophosphorylase family protein